MTTKQKVIAFTLGAMIAVSLLGCGQPFAQAAEPVKYELNIKLVPTEALKAAHPEARVLDYPASKIEGHSDFASKDECEAHFTDSDLLGIAMAMYQQAGLKIDEDFTAEHECKVKGTEI